MLDILKIFGRQTKKCDTLNIFSLRFSVFVHAYSFRSLRPDMLYCLAPRQFRGHSLFAIYQGCRIRNGTSEWPSSYFLRFRGLKIAKIGHNWRVSKIGTKPYAGYTAVSYLERIRCYREKSPLLAPSGMASIGTFTRRKFFRFSRFKAHTVPFGYVFAPSCVWDLLICAYRSLGLGITFWIMVGLTCY